MTTILIQTQNPDSRSIADKNIIVMPLSTFDISASGYFNESIKTSYSNTTQLLTLPVYNTSSLSGYVYYTPLYKEKLNYEVWKQRVNKNFQELT